MQQPFAERPRTPSRQTVPIEMAAEAGRDRLGPVAAALRPRPWSRPARRRGRACAALLALCLIPSGARAVSFTFEGTTPDTSIDVRFTADLSIVGDTLTLVLTNDSLNHVDGPSPTRNPNDLLTSFYFDVFNGISRPTLTFTGATGDVCLTSKAAVDDCGVVVDKEDDLRAFAPRDGTWQFQDTLSLQFGSDVLTFGVGTAGNNSLAPSGFSGNIVGGFDYGLYAGDVSTNNLDNRFLTTGSITFTWSGATGFSDVDIADEVVFGLGTQPDSTGLVPEPGTGLLVGTGLLLLAWRRSRA